MPSYWKQRAEEAVKAGYLPGNAWEKSLLTHMRRVLPVRVEELEATDELQAYLIVQTQAAMEAAETMEEQGTPPQQARELAMNQLFQPPEEEEDTPEAWELEGAHASIEAAVQQKLLKP